MRRRSALSGQRIGNVSVRIADMPMSEQDFESSFVSENQAISFEINMRAKRQCFLSKRGGARGEKTWVFHPRTFMAEAWSRMHRQSALSGQQNEFSKIWMRLRGTDDFPCDCRIKSISA